MKRRRFKYQLAGGIENQLKRDGLQPHDQRLLGVIEATNWRHNHEQSIQSWRTRHYAEG